MNIVEAIEQYESDASARGSLSTDRQEALDRYLGKPYGDEVEGRSQIVMRDVADTVEWIKPSLLKVFCAGEEVVKFDATGPEDEAAAGAETAFCNHVVMSRNNGFMLFHDWFHDALLQRNGYVWACPIKKRSTQREVFKGLTDDEFALVLQSEGIELVEHSEEIDQTPTTDGMPPMRLHNAVVRQVKEETKVCLYNAPPENVLIAQDWGGLDLQDCPFTEIIVYKSISALREEGYDVDDDIDDSSQYNEDEWEKDNRAILADSDNTEDDRTGPDRLVKVRYVWIRADSDGDGISELRRVVLVGKEVLDDEEDDLVPVAALTPFRMSHEHTGRSVDDLVQDLQRIRTVLMRGFLDNMYLSMHGRNAIDTNRVNLDDMLVTRPGGVVRVNGDPSQAIFPLAMPNNGAGILEGVEYIDGVRENRTGVSRVSMGLNPDSLNNTATGRALDMSAAQQRIELIARIFAESGVKALMMIVHALSLKHGRQREMLKLNGQWVPIDPRSWKTRTSLTVSVGIGTGDKQMTMQNLMMILQEQKMALPTGMATPANIYNTMKRITVNAGFKAVDEFWTDISQQPPQEPQIPPEIQKVQMQLQADAQKFGAESQAKMQEMERSHQLRMTELQANLELQATNDQRDSERQSQKAILDAQMQQAEQQNKAAIAAMQAEVDKYKADLDAKVKLIIAGVNAEDGFDEPDEPEGPKVSESIAALSQQLAMMQESMNAPAEIVRDQNGRAIGIMKNGAMRAINRDQSGRATGVA
jgi:hypothetical protein